MGITVCFEGIRGSEASFAHFFGFNVLLGHDTRNKEYNHAIIDKLSLLSKNGAKIP